MNGVTFLFGLACGSLTLTLTSAFLYYLISNEDLPKGVQLESLPEYIGWDVLKLTFLLFAAIGMAVRGAYFLGELFGPVRVYQYILVISPFIAALMIIEGAREIIRAEERTEYDELPDHQNPQAAFSDDEE